VYVWHNKQEKNISRSRTNIRERCNDTERQNLFSMMAETISLVFYQEMKYKSGREEYIDFWFRNERSGMSLMTAGVWKLRGLRWGFEKGTFPLRMGRKDIKHMLMSCTETKEWRTQLTNKK
jgi:hypothetical protein